ncbi:hypothetical protein Calab_2977 [Caldithrix abyssi DSM 13497]|uniref:Uncharacterized protein n=1 Tax=Caldithrix abyssi DSM 13497 TaxID=880073 RepID=H1XSN6_CALAY|nr:hypothetical protein [Caldithrix abyssi]APF18596.1 hypothetical protein Cabys_1847 [Caldithrix abyssi DSM 13497]EHO42584.1 hypothetical protein Calab_2977 [Caldithrix abyssi DSM 13497]
MNKKELLMYFVTTFAVTLVVTAIVTFLYSLIVHGTGTVDWETSFRFAIILGIVLSWTKARESKPKER